MTIIEDIARTVEVCGTPMSEAAARIFVAELSKYPKLAVHAALERCRLEVFGRLALAHVIERIDDGRPGPEEAWAMIPRDEHDSAAITGEMAAAMSAALALLPNEIAARMAFVETYRRKLAEARARRDPVAWRMTLGFDRAGRESALRDAVKLGRISSERAEAMGLLPEPSDALQIPGPVEGSPAEMARSLAAQMAMAGRLSKTKRIDDAMSAAEIAHGAGRRCATGCDRCWVTGMTEEA